MTTKIKATWQNDSIFLAEDERGGKALLGGEGIYPMQMLLVSLAGCTGVDVVNILKKKRAKLHDLRVEVSGERADTHPKVYTDIHVSYLLWGEGLKKKDVEQAIELSEEKYCSVSAMLRSTAKIHSDYQIYETEENND